jgi:quercetin dioxygenase-like cupin family protein
MKRAPNQPISELRIYGGIFLKTWTVADAGTLLPQHAHAYDHLSMIVSGAVRVWRGGEMIGEYAAPATVRIPAEVMHTFLTLQDDVVIACIHAVDASEADVAIAAEHHFELED